MMQSQICSRTLQSSMIRVRLNLLLSNLPRRPHMACKLATVLHRRRRQLQHLRFLRTSDRCQRQVPVCQRQVHQTGRWAGSQRGPTYFRKEYIMPHLRTTCRQWQRQRERRGQMPLVRISLLAKGLMLVSMLATATATQLQACHTHRSCNPVPRQRACKHANQSRT